MTISPALTVAAMQPFHNPAPQPHTLREPPQPGVPLMPARSKRQGACTECQQRCQLVIQKIFGLIKMRQISEKIF